MARLNPIPGSSYRLERESDSTPGTFVFVGVTTIEATDATEFDDAMVPDLEAPTALLTRVSTPKSRTTDWSVSGIADKAAFVGLLTDYRTATSHRYRLRTDLSGARGGESETGTFVIPDLKHTMSDNGTVRFSASLRGQGDIVYAAAL